MNEQIKKTAKAIPLDANTGKKRMNSDHPVLEGAPTRQCYICKCKEQPRALHVDLGAIWLCDNCKAKMEEQDIKQIEEMKIDVLESIAWKDLDDDVTALDIDSTTEHLRSKGYRKQEWISVEDRLPDKNDKYWVTDGKEVFTLHFCAKYNAAYDANSFNEGKFTYRDYKGDYVRTKKNITHWMPYEIPEPPKMKGGAE